jgi:hypothetical protein
MADDIGLKLSKRAARPISDRPEGASGFIELG